MGKFAPDDRSDLRNFLGGAEPIEAGHQGSLQARRHGEGLRRAGGRPRTIFALCLQYRLGHLFNKQGHAVGTFYDVQPGRLRQRRGAGDTGDQIADFAPRQPIDGE